MFKLIKDKRGGEKYLSIWWFFVLIIIAGGIVVAVIAFNSTEVNTKELEADILVTRVVNCVVDNGYINQDFLKGNLDIFQNCYLNKDMIDYKGDEKTRGNYYLNINIYKFDDCNIVNNLLECKNSLINNYNFGVANFQEECKIGRAMREAKDYPLCSERYVYVLDKENKKLILYVIAGSNNVIEK